MIEQQTIQDENDIRKYFAMIPHMADDELDPYEYRLLGHYYRVCGANDGQCTEGTRKSGERCQMSKSKVSDVRQSLAMKGWITLEYMYADEHKEQIEYVIVKLVNRWAENVMRYAKQDGVDTRPQDGQDAHEGVYTTRTGCPPDDHKNNQSGKTAALRNSSGDESHHGFVVGSHVFYVLEKRGKAAKIMEGVVYGGTPKMVRVDFGDSGKKTVRPKSLHRTKPKLERKTDRTQNAVLELVYGIQSNAPIGKSTMTYANQVQSALLDLPGGYPSPLEIWAAYKHYKIKNPRLPKPSNAMALMRMVSTYRDYQEGLREAAERYAVSGPTKAQQAEALLYGSDNG
jgi:hypothetical protein